MKTIDMMGKACPIPVIEAKKALSADDESRGVLVMVDNSVSVSNLEKMANGYGFKFSYTEKEKGCYEVLIDKDGKSLPQEIAVGNNAGSASGGNSGEIVVLIGQNTMGSGSEELGKILIKGFIYSLSELPAPPSSVIFLNSGAYLTSSDANTVDDLKSLEQKGSEILTCGTCVNFYELQGKLAVGTITDMFGITERLAKASRVINI